MTWREQMRPLVRATLADASARSLTPIETRRLLRSVRPCQRSGWAYRLDEVARQQGRKSGPVEIRSKKARQERNDESRQIPLFDPLVRHVPQDPSGDSDDERDQDARDGLPPDGGWGMW